MRIGLFIVACLLALSAGCGESLEHKLEQAKISLSSGRPDAALTFALILWLSLIGLGLYLIVNELKRFFIPWHESVYGLRNQGA